MPMRDHFRAPMSDRFSWDMFHGGWPMMLARQLNRILPPQFMAGPNVHLGTGVEVDIGTFDLDPSPDEQPAPSENGLRWEAAPSVAVETELLDPSEYEVRIYEVRENRRLVAAIELVSPANKDRPEARSAFALKCHELLRHNVCVVMVDVVTVRNFNLYIDLLNLIHQGDPSQGNPPTSTYAASCRWVPRGKKRVLETWSHVLTLGHPLPTLPLWLTEDLCVPLNLEISYEETLQDLRMA